MRTFLPSLQKSISANRSFGKPCLLIIAGVLCTGIALFAASKNVGKLNLVAKARNHQAASANTNKLTGHKAGSNAAQGVPVSVDYGSSRFTFHTGTAVSLTPVSSGVAAPAAGVYSGPAVLGTGLNFSQNGLALDAAGNMYLNDQDSGTGEVKKITADGSTTTIIGSGFLTQSANVAVDRAGNVYVADQATVWKIPASGNPVTYDTPVVINNTFTRPFAIAVDAADSVYVTDLTAGGVYKMASDGSNKTRIDNGTINSGSGLAADAAGNVYVVDIALNALYEIPANGSPQVQLANGFSFPRGVALDGAGNIYIDDESANTIYKVPAGGGSPTAEIPGLTNAVGVAVDAMYNVYVGLQSSAGINKFSPTGGYFISPVLPAGLSFDNTTGAITGTPTTVTAQKSYIISAYNTDGGISDTLKLKVSEPIPVFSYTSPSSPYMAGTAITPLSPTASGVEAPGYAAPELISDDIFNPLGTAVDNQGNVYVADMGDNLVKKIDIVTGASTDIGTGFSSPSGVAVDKNGNVYVADADNSVVKEILASDGSTVALSAVFNRPIGVAVDDAGNVYVADVNDAAAYKIPAGGGPLVTLATDFDDLTGIAVDSHGNVYVSDGFAQSVYRIAAKGGGAIDIGFSFTFPTAISVDAAGNLYVADGNGGLVYKVEGGKGNPVSTGFAYLFAGGVSVDKAGNLFVTDAGAGALYEAAPSGGYVLQTPLPAGLRFNDTTGTVSGKPSAAAAVATYTVIAYNAGGGAQASFSLEVDLPPAPTISYTTPNTYVAGSGAITPLAPTATGVGSPGYNSTPVIIASGFNQPGGAAVDTAGNIYFADSGNNKVMMLPKNGDPAIELGSGFQFPTGVALDAAGNIYVADQGNGLVKKMPPGGGTPVSIGSGFSGPSAVAVDSGGNVYVADGSDATVYKITPGGATTALGGGFNQLTGIAVDGKDNLYFTDGGDHAVYKVALAGGIPANIGCYFNYPSGIAVDNSGNVYVTDKTDNTLYRIIKGGNRQVAIGMGFNAPAGVAVDAMGIVYIGDTGNNSIDKLLPSGGYFINATLPQGLKFSGTTGAISGTPAGASAAKNYKVTAYSYGGSASATVNIAVTLPPAPTLSYPTPLVYAVGSTIVPVAPTSSNVAAVGYSGSLAVVDTGYIFPSSLATDKLGNIYVTDSGNDTLYKIPPGGTRIPVGTGFSQPTGVAVDAAGNIYVADAGNAAVKKIPAGSNTPVSIGSGFVFPATIAVDAAGDVYVGDDAGCSCGSGTSKVYKITAKTGAMTTLSSTIASPGAIAIDPAGNVFVTDLGTGYIYKLRKGSNNAIRFGTYVFNTPYGLTIDGAGNLYVADAAIGEIDEIPAAGGALIPITSGFSLPYGIALATNGNLLITDILKGNIEKIQPGGGYYISPGLPAGLSINNATGILSGTPTAATPATNYTVTAFNFGGGTPAVVNIKVGSTNAKLAVFTTTPKVPLPVVAGTHYRDYATSVISSFGSISIVATVQDTTATITVNGVTATSGSPSTPISLNADTTTIYTTVTAGDGVTKNTYALKINRKPSNNAKLATITTVPKNTLTLVAGANFRNYETSVINSLSSIGIIATTLDPGATIKVNGVPATSGTASSPVQLHADTTTIFTTVTAADGVTKNTYAIKITRKPSTDAKLATFTTTPKFPLPVVTGTHYRDYEATVLHSVTAISVIATTEDVNATITVNGAAATSGTPFSPIQLNADTTTIYTTVTAGDGITKNTYALKVTRKPSNNSRLATFTINPKVPLPLVTGTHYRDYTATVANLVSSVRVIATTQEAAETLTVNGIPATSGIASSPVSLHADTTSIYTTVTAADGVTKSTYAVLVTRLPAPGMVMKYEQQTLPIIADAITVHQNVSPNGDGNSDGLVIEGITAFPDNKIQIMSRSGALVYEAKGYDNATKVFDGHASTNGKLQQAGTYFYSLEYKDGNEVKRKTGFIVLKY